jgi:hypothetical protein
MKSLRFLLLTLLLCFSGPVCLSKDYTPQEFFVVSTSESPIFHVAGARNYANMLKQNKRGTIISAF